MTRGKEAGRGRSSGAGIKGGKSLSHGGSGLLGKETSLVTGQVSSQLTSMGGIEGVDKRIDSSTVSAVRNKAAGQRSGGSGDGGFGFELGSVGVESEVSVGGVMGVDEGVEVGVNWLVIILLVVRDQGLGLDGLRGNPDGGASNGASSLLNGGGSGANWLGLGNESGSILT